MLRFSVLAIATFIPVAACHAQQADAPMAAARGTAAATLTVVPKTFSLAGAHFSEVPYEETLFYDGTDAEALMMRYQGVKMTIIHFKPETEPKDLIRIEVAKHVRYLTEWSPDCFYRVVAAPRPFAMQVAYARRLESARFVPHRSSDEEAQIIYCFKAKTGKTAFVIRCRPGEGEEKDILESMIQACRFVNAI